MVVAGGGAIGMACALELRRYGRTVMLLERGELGSQASWAAAGMLAANDPQNPVALRSLAQMSIELYPDFLKAVAGVTGVEVPFETNWTHEGIAGGTFEWVKEWSLDPRKLMAALALAVRASGVEIFENCNVLSCLEGNGQVEVSTDRGTFAGKQSLDCRGAWTGGAVRPAKGQMLRVYAPGVMAQEGRGNVVVRTADVYAVPRLDGSVVIGATVEDAGFDTVVHEVDVQALRARAATLVPALAEAQEMERWAGLRPDTPDHLPLMGQTAERAFTAAGHFRNGVLLAPATAKVMAELMRGAVPSVDLRAFAPSRLDT